MTVRRHLPKNLVMRLEDGRTLLVRSGKGDYLTARQKGQGSPIHVGETVESKPVKDGSKVVLEALSRTKKDIKFRILGIRVPEGVAHEHLSD